jgi:hypothetical protein
VVRIWIADGEQDYSSRNQSSAYKRFELVEVGSLEDRVMHTMCRHLWSV